MLELDSPTWATLSHAYGDASNVPGLLFQLQTATGNDWSDINDELMSAIIHQGDVYTATYAAASHLMQLASDYGPCWQSDDLLQSIGYASRGGPGPSVPESLEEDWEDAQSDARDLILERLINGEVSEKYAGSLIGALLYLSGEWAAGELVTDWCWGTSIKAACPQCSAITKVFWHNDQPKTTRETPRSFWQRSQFKIVPVPIGATSSLGLEPDLDLEFETDQLHEQILGLAVSSGHAKTKRQFQTLFGTVQCNSCGQPTAITPAISPSAP